ncbi:ABC transporter permease [Streptomyces sp. NPDC020875]|uniref:ABC transporter permease n=1 Tax=Streptomyces sp. NPDC020875 TaxID=3154898 RepID=UPI0033E5F856
MPWTRRSAAVLLLVPVVVAATLWAFAWPGARTAPRELPVAVAGPAAAAEQVSRGLERRDGAFDISRYEDEAAARTAIGNRDVYGAVVAGPDGIRLLTASAASPAVAALLREAVAAGAERPVETVDVVPTPAADPRGGVLAASVLPLSMAGIVLAVLVTLLGLRGVRAAVTLVAAAAGGGVVTALVTHSWLGILTGSWWGEAGAAGLTVLAVAAASAGPAALVGRAGLAAGSVLTVLIGNPFSGAASAPELLPEPMGALGALLPPGAGAQLIRSQAYFDGAASTGPLLVLTVWVALGLTAVLLGARRGRLPLGPRSFGLPAQL